jgi:hypothetical protein
MTGIEFAVGVLVAWLVKKARHVRQRVDQEIDQAIDTGMDRLHQLVMHKLGVEPALAKLETEVAQTGASTERTQQRVQLALEDAVEDDPAFGTQLQAIVDEIRAAQARAGHASAGDHGIAVAGDIEIHAETGSAAAWRMGDVTIGGDGHTDPHLPE